MITAQRPILNSLHEVIENVRNSSDLFQTKKLLADAKRRQPVSLFTQPTRKRTPRTVLVPKRCFSFRRISDLEICSSS
jgi:hypothetical protein